MKIKALSVALASVLWVTGGAAIAGPDKVAIEHAPPADNGKGKAINEDGNVPLDVSLPAAVAHLATHEGDCLYFDQDAQEDVVAALGYDPEYCGGLGGSD